MAYIVTHLNTAGAGEVFVNAYSDPGSLSHMLVYVSPDNEYWYELPSGSNYISSNSADYYDCGSANQAYPYGAIDYVLVLGWDPTYIVSLEVDSVQLIDNPTLTVYAYVTYGPFEINHEVSGGDFKLDGWPVFPGFLTTALTVPLEGLHVSDGYHVLTFNRYAQDPVNYNVAPIYRVYEMGSQDYQIEIAYEYDLTFTVNVAFNHDVCLYLIYFDPNNTP